MPTQLKYFSYPHIQEKKVDTDTLYKITLYSLSKIII